MAFHGKKIIALFLDMATSQQSTTLFV